MENQDQKDKRIKMVERIKKLLAKATCSHTAKGADGELSPEAQVAMKMAESLIREYSVDQAELFIKEGKEGIKITETVLQGFGIWDDRNWQCDLGVSIYRCFDCQGMLRNNVEDEDGDYGWEINFIGTPSDVEISSWLFTYIRRWIAHEAKKAVIAKGKPKTKIEIVEALKLIGRKGTIIEIDMWWKDIAHRMEVSFCLAAAEIVSRRIQDMYQRNKAQETSDCTALVVCKDQLVASHMAVAYPKSKTTKRENDGHLHKEMSQKGAIEGARIPLTKAIK